MALQIVAVGTGRDGTVSLTQLLNDLYQRHGLNGLAVHEYEARAFYNNFCSWKEDGSGEAVDRLRRLIAECPHRAIVGNGYASVLPLFAELWPDVALIHVRRRDRDALIRSHMNNQKLFPETYVYYGSDSGDMKRTTAFHVGEMTRDQWETLSLYDRFGWFYDYTHREIEQAKPLFRNVLEVCTEDLSDPAVLKAIGKLAAGSDAAPPPAVALNRHTYASVGDFTEESRAYGQWLFGRFDMAKLQADPVYFTDYASNAFITWMGYLISGFAQELGSQYRAEDTEIRRTVERFIDVLRSRSWEAGLLLHELDLKKGTEGSPSPQTKQDEAAN